MKIAVISPNPQHLHDIARVLTDSGHLVLTFEGGKTRARAVADRERPDLLLVDGICRDPHELANIEQVTAAHPATTVILLCASHSPEFLLGAMRAGVREVLPSPVPHEALQAAVDRLAVKSRGHGSRRGKVLAFVGCKGGSGATFLATNLGWQLADRGSVLLIDLNLQFGDALAFLHDGKPQATLADLCKDIGRLDAALLAAGTVKLAPNYSLLPAPHELSQAIEVRAEHVAALLDLAVQQHDFVVLDLPRNLDAVAVTALDRAWRIFAVLQAGLADLRHAGRLLQAFRALGYPDDRVELIVNRYDKSSEIGLDQVRRSVAPGRLTTVPNAWRDVIHSVNHGEPLARSARNSAVVRQLAELAQSIDPQPQDGRGLLDRLFRKA